MSAGGVVVRGEPAALAALAEELLGRCQFPPPGPVALAVSGGADSVALLLLARAARLDALVIHVDHGLRPGSQGEAELVRDLAERHGAAFEARRVEVTPGPNLEARARRARYDALPPGVLTGHTADDQAETILLNLLRGCGLDGLAGMRGGRGPAATRVGRPLLALRRAETARLCRLAGETPIADPSNDDLRFRRNQVRHQLVPLLGQIGERDPVPVLARLAGLLDADADYLDQLAAALDPTDARALAAAPPPLAGRAVRQWLRAGSDSEQHPPAAAEVARVLAVARGEVRACQLPGGRRVERSAGRLRLVG